MKTPGIGVGRRIQEEADIESQRTDRRRDPQAGAGTGAQLAGLEPKRSGPHIARIDESDKGDHVPDSNPDLCVCLKA